jgi:hypothetical protein
MAGGEGFLQDEARLGHRAIDGIDQEQNAVHDQHHPLDLAAEVRVAGGIDDVDLVAFVGERRVLTNDRDAALTLLVHAIHDALGDFLVVAEDPALLEHSVEEGRLSVIYMGDDGDISEHSRKKSPPGRGRAVPNDQYITSAGSFVVDSCWLLLIHPLILAGTVSVGALDQSTRRTCPTTRQNP